MYNKYAIKVIYSDWFAKNIELAMLDKINEMSDKKLDLPTLEYVKLVIEVVENDYTTSPSYIRINSIIEEVRKFKQDAERTRNR